MKKKTLLALIAVATLSLAACGKTEETSGSNVNEPVIESTVESQVAENTETATQESQTAESTEVTSSETPSSEEAPAVAEKSYEVSALMMPDGSAYAPEKLPFPEDSSLVVRGTETPYYTITNTSDSAYSINIALFNNNHTDNNFEAGESITLPAIAIQNDEFMGWCNIEDAMTLDDLNYFIIVDEANSLVNQGDRIHEMTTITFDASVQTPADANNSRSSVPALMEKATLNNFMPTYIVLYDEAGNAIPGSYAGLGLSEDGTAIFLYHPAQNAAGEPFAWASADVYYSYEAAQ